VSDLGLFGPSSVTWKVHGEPILALAGLRALFIQSLHPRALAGVIQNSDFRVRPWHRLETTATYVVTVIFGTTAEAEAAGERVRAVHSRLRATDPRTGERFRLDEPDLLRWVHVVEVESFLDIARRSGVRVTDDEADEYFREQRRAAALVGLDPATVPGSRAEVAAYYEAHRTDFEVPPAEPGERAAATQRIDIEIRQILAPVVEAEREAGYQAWRARLLAAARIEKLK